ncbi:hypothetical protein [Bifidobacterium sp. ESL0764]|uniref:hypothetical protein n=1 Tax=Bifidobacterium sp. ESL0764 TaxID=2983228 RepID=UPI0023F71547|nr:hypothetical protein [Bifidobacterium sp. ESL0764]WEV65240.1 hypothetical protein OZX71_05555 [Bifidobacterium sp. ESL0764]
MKNDRVRVLSIIGALLSAMVMMVGLVTTMMPANVSVSADNAEQSESTDDDSEDEDSPDSSSDLDSGSDANSDSSDAAKQMEARSRELEKRQKNGYYGSDAQEYAPKDSQMNPKTDVARAYWACSPQSLMDDMNFRYQLSDDQSEMTLRLTKPYDANLKCIADNLEIYQGKIVNDQMKDHKWHNFNVANLQFKSRIMGDSADKGWLDLIVKEDVNSPSKGSEQDLNSYNGSADPNNHNDTSAYCNTLTGDSKLQCESMNEYGNGS